MRLWHYELISVLPNKMLVAQWRECIAIKRQWEKGTLKHRLVSYIMNYTREYFLAYVFAICEELNKRNVKYQHKYLIEIEQFCHFPDVSNIHYIEHNHRYLCQCYYNLQEKYDRGIISEDEFIKIENFMKEVTVNG